MDGLRQDWLASDTAFFAAFVLAFLYLGAVKAMAVLYEDFARRKTPANAKLAIVRTLNPKS